MFRSRLVARFIGRFVAVTLVGGAMLPLMLTATAAHALDPCVNCDYGWWWRANASPTTAVTVPGPPEQVVPSDGLYVALAQSGDIDPAADPTKQVVQPSAVAAIRFTDLPNGAEADMVLTLAPNNNADVSQQAPVPLTLQACLPGSQWDSTQAGQWSSKPLWDCDTNAVTGESAQSGQAFSFHFTSEFITDGVLDVILVPKGTTPYQLAFKAPDAQTLTVIGGTDPELTPSADAGAATDPSLDLSSAGLPADIALGDTGAGLTDTSSGTLGTGAVSGTGRVRAALPIKPAALAKLPDSRTERIMAVLLLLALAAALWWVGGQPTRAPRLLGSAVGGGTAAVDVPVSLGGVGRFARQRIGRPTRL
jgi:hypothetical protein